MEFDAENQFNSVTRTSIEKPSHKNRYQRSQKSERDNGFDIDEGDELVQNPLNRGPYFDVTASKNVTTLVGTTAYLNCRVLNLSNKTVTWIRHRDLHLLTVGKATYTPDNRFQSVYNPQLSEWSLKVLYPQKQDSGIYECQVGSSPPVGISMSLSIVEPVTTIMGIPEMFIDTGSTINLTCIVSQSPNPPTNILWTHNDEEVNYDSPRGGVSVITEKGDVTTSYLLIQRAKSKDSGKYVCSPSNAINVSIQVHVLNGEHPAAIQCGNKTQI